MPSIYGAPLRYLLHPAEDLVHLQAQLLAELEVLVRDAELAEVVPVEQGVAQLVVLVAQLDDGSFELSALLVAEAPGERTCGHVAHDDLDGEHLEPAGLYRRVVYLLDEFGRDAVGLQVGEDRGAHGRVGTSLVLPRAALLGVESGRVVLVAVDEHALLVRREHLLRLAFVQQLLSHSLASPSGPLPSRRRLRRCAARARGRRGPRGPCRGARAPPLSPPAAPGNPPPPPTPASPLPGPPRRRRRGSCQPRRARAGRAPSTPPRRPG